MKSGMIMNIPEMYLNGEYLRNNPSWDSEDAPWKAGLIHRMIQKHHLEPSTICEVGCGSGEILRSLQELLPQSVDLSGFEIAPAAYNLCREKENAHLHYYLGDITRESDRTYDLILLIDIIEHLEDCFSFLRAMRSRAPAMILHIPLEMFALSTLYPQFYLGQWKKVGHLHFFSKETAFQLLNDTGFEIVDSVFTAGFALPRDYGIKDSLLKIPRKFFFPLSPDLTVRIFGGYSLLVLVKS